MLEQGTSTAEMSTDLGVTKAVSWAPALPRKKENAKMALTIFFKVLLAPPLQEILQNSQMHLLHLSSGHFSNYCLCAESQDK